MQGLFIFSCGIQIAQSSSDLHVVEVRERAGLVEGTTLVLLDTPTGLVLLTREQLRDRVRSELAGLDLVDQLLAERRAAAAAEDAA